ncbi:MAG: GPW/gp25 family protein [Anaerolineae bacterium]|nr:GPW/gp25 family protein [Anaerolineae bacterium]
MNDRDKTFLGQGWAFPISADASGQVRLVRYEEDIRQAILLILSTARGERPMRPDFAADLQGLIFEPMNTTTISLVKLRVTEALVNWEPRIDQITVTVTPFPAEGKLDVELSYRVRLTNTFYNLVYPFYLLEGSQS